ncbi:Orcokinin peptides type A [Pseudolycoriella hygida]|uniref:Orcokinin peptides type A n=1 Tax=Pseudolycoriella hygida TaxID=35572 RepID=A0A9Q0NBU7_9DIPT|nr:Orcokinin peptides type A [Pseudolycoriella hygida]
MSDQEIDELIYRLQELKHQSRYNGGNEEIANQNHEDYGPRNWDALLGYEDRIDDIGLPHAIGTEINQNSHSKPTLHPVVDLERKPLLYDYYATTLNPVNEKRFDEIDRVGMVGFQGKRNFDEIDRSGFSGFHGKRNFDEIDRSGLRGFHGKRNFDEIDRLGLSGFHRKRSADNSERLYDGPEEINSVYGDLLNRYDSDDVVKRNFDEIDRFGPGGFLKRNFQHELDVLSRLGSRGSQLSKKNFDEIDRFGFSGLKRNSKFTIDQGKTLMKNTKKRRENSITFMIMLR